MRRTEVVAGLLTEYDAFAALIADLTPEEWRTATRCEGWEVRDVAGHVTGTAVDVQTGVIGTRTPDEQARALRDEAPGDLAGRLGEAAESMRPFLEAVDDDAWAGPSPVPDRSLGNGVLALWNDAFLHADDIRTALGRPGEHGPGLHASVHWVRDELERRGWGPARLVLDGVGECSLGTGGPVLRGDPMRFLLVATGRADPAEFGVDAGVNVYA
jgi:uncharacterized protein (TIGR03083 family)